MGDFTKDRKFGGKRDFKRRDFDIPRVMHKTICSNCGKECEVPFIPNGKKPVFCRECFQNNRSSDSVKSDNNYPRRSNFENRSNSQIDRPLEQPQYREPFEALNAKLDKILRILEPKTAVVVVSTETPKDLKINSELKEIKTPKAKKVAKKSTSTKKK